MELTDLVVDEDRLVDIAEESLTNENSWKNLRAAPVVTEDGLLFPFAVSGEEFGSITVEKLGGLMPEFLHGPHDPMEFAVVLKYWPMLKEEFRDLLCTDSAKYRDIRRSASKQGNKSQTAIVSMIAAGVSAHVGIAAGVLVPFCAICLLAAGMGVNAFCKQQMLDIPVVKQPKNRKRPGPSAQ